MGRPKHKLHGKRGPWLEANCKDGVTRYYAWQNRGEEIIRGSDRKGIKANNFSAEAVWTNDTTSPRFEVPRVVIETMRSDIKTVSAQDVAVFWRLFSQARMQGMEQETHTITLSAIKGYLDIHARARILGSLTKLSAASMSLHVNQPDAHGRVGMQMVEAFEIDGDTISFRLPTVLRNAVLNSRDYAWADINAIVRFTSKFTASLYLKLCLEAGKHWSKRSMVEDSRAEFRDRVGLPESTKTAVLEDVLHRVRADLLAISGPRRRFDIQFDAAMVDERMQIAVGSAAKKLKEVKPKNLTRPALIQVVESNKGVLSVPASRYPALVRLRQAATMLGTSVLSVSDMWRMDVYGATSYPSNTFVGLTGAQFIGLIDQYGADDVLEFWCEKRDLSHLGIQRVAVDVGEAQIVKRRGQKKAAVIEIRVVEVETAREDDLRMAEDFGVMDYGNDDLPEFGPAAVEWDDDDIPA